MSKDHHHAGFGAPLHSPEATKRLLHGVRDGRIIDLGRAVSSGAPRLPLQAEYRLDLADLPVSEMFGGSNAVHAYAEHAQMTFHVGTHIDALGHFAAHEGFFGGVARDAVYTPEGLITLGIEHAPPIITRAVVIDAAGLGRVDSLGGTEAISAADLERMVTAQKLTIGPGDVVMIRTGWGKYFGVDNASYTASEPGIDESAARWLTARKVAAVGADTMALEVLPFTDPKRVFPVHQHLLGETGTYIIENLDLDQLCAEGVRDCLLVLLPVPFIGATASPARPIAIL